MDPEATHNFTSPARSYVAQQLQISFPFGKEYEEKTIKTFETPSAEYEVRAVECYLTEKEAGGKSSLDLSRPLRPKSRLFFSSSWFEVYKINNCELDYLVEENVHEGNSEETARFLLELDDGHKHFSYCGRDRFSRPEILDGCAYRSRPLDQDEQNLLDNLIKQKLDVLYRR